MVNTALNLSFSWNRNSLYGSGSLSATVGRRQGGRYRYFSLSQGAEIAPGWTASLAAEGSILSAPAAHAATTTQVVLTTTYQLTPEKSLAARVVHRDGEGLNIFASYGQRMRRGMDVFVLLGDPDPETRNLGSRLAAKLLWTFD